MPQGKYQVKRVIAKKHGASPRFEVYSVIDGEVVCVFDNEEKAHKYAAKINGKEGA